MICKIKCVASLDTQKVAVDPALVAIVSANNFHPSIRPANTQSRFTAVGTMCAGCSDVLHLPRPSFISIRARGQRTHRTNINAHPAFLTLEMILFVRSNDRAYSPVLHAQ